MAALALAGVETLGGLGSSRTYAIGDWGWPNGRIPASAMTYMGTWGSTDLYLRPDAAQSMLSMQAAYQGSTGGSLNFNEGYRDLATQQYYWNLYQSGQGNVAAYPGTSNHGWALAVDFELPGNQFAWLQANAAAFGWDWSTGQASGEPWHWEYIREYAPPTQPPKETKVMESYHREDHNVRSLAPGGQTFLTDPSINHDLNVVGVVGAYSITPHLYVEGLDPEDSMQITLVWENTRDNPTPWVNASPHYTETVRANRDGKINHTTTFLRGVNAGDMVFVRVNAPASNKNAATITVIDCDAFSFATV